MKLVIYQARDTSLLSRSLVRSAHSTPPRSLVRASSLFAWLITLMLATGCASTGPSSSQRSAAGSDMRRTALISSRTTQAPSREECPSSDKSWRLEKTATLINLANKCAQLGKFDRVEQMGNLLAQRESLTPWGPFYLSVAAEGKKEYPRAIWMIDLALKKAPRMALLHYEKGRILWAAGEFGAGVRSYEAAVKEDNTFTDAHLFLGQLYYRDQNFPDADKHFSQVLRQEPSNIPATVGLAETKIQTGDLNRGLALYEQAVNLEPRNVGYRVRLAALYETVSKDYAQALSTYKKLRTLMGESRATAESVNVNVEDKIRRLEEQVGADSKKVSRAPTAQKGKVKK